MNIFKYTDREIDVRHTIDSYPDRDDYILHVHEHFELYYFIKGKGRFSVEGTVYSMEPGTLLVMQPAESHKLFIDPSEPYERITVHFLPARINAFDPDRRLLQPFLDRPLGHWNCYRRSESGGSIQLSSLIYALCPVGVTDENEKRLAVFSHLLTLLYSLRTAYAQKRREDSSGAHRDVSLTLVEYINNHLGDDLTLERLSNEMFLSPSQISRIFRRATGTSVLQYASIKRMMHARHLISGGVSASEACRQCGYGDYSSFYRAYKKRFGTAPTER